LTKTRILFECGGTWESDANTGIQRVVRNIIKEAPGIEKDFDIESIAVVVKFNQFCRAGKKSAASLSKAGFLNFFKEVYYNVRPLLKRFLLLERIEYFLVLYARSLLSVIFSIVFFLRTLKLYFQSKIVPGKGDILLLLDSSWVYSIWSAVKKAKKNGAVVGLIVYDIIPLTHPNFFSSVIIKRFNIWFEQAVQQVDFFICISETVQIEVQKYLQQNYPDYQTHGRLSFFSLGCTLDNISNNSLVGNEHERLFQRSSIYVVVGTIEPRKNHKYLLDAFDLVWQQCPNVVLCIIGKKRGWLNEQVMRRIKTHPLFKYNLFLLNNVSDTKLAYCYRHSTALVISSYVEGFGLPIIEALHYELPVLASDIPIHREVGKDFCTYFDINNPAGLAKIIINIEKTGKMPQVRSNKEYKMTTWKDSCRELFSRIQALSSTVT